MEIKLFVRTHKENFGSVLLFSNNMLPKEKKIMEDIKYTTYEPDEMEIIEISVPGFFIYFCTYIGGQDEYGRDYQNVIGTIFPFRITESDVLNLRKTFKEIMKDISSHHFSEENRYFSEIKSKSTHKYHSKSGSTLFRFNMKKFFMFIVLISALSFLGFKMKNHILPIFSNTPKSVEPVDFDGAVRKKCNLLMKSIQTEKEISIKYALYKELISEIEKTGKSIKQSEAEKKYNQIITEYQNNRKDNSYLIVLIDEYLKNSDFNYNIEKVESIKNKLQKGNEISFLKNFESKIDNYNNSPNGEKLSELITSCKDSFPLLSSKEKKSMQNILTQAENIYNGINSEIEIHISDKSAVFNRRTLGFELQVDNQDYLYKNKPMNNEPNIYAGSFNVKLSPFSKVKVKIFDHSYSGKKILLKALDLDFAALNKPVLITDSNDNSFKAEIRVIYDKFKIRSNNF